jgi:hypothetical protein
VEHALPKPQCDQSQHQMSKWIPSKKKNPVIKNQGWEPIQQRYKANENTSRHNRKKKQKQTINKDQVMTVCKEDS